jgi:hypothetical protein
MKYIIGDGRAPDGAFKKPNLGVVGAGEVLITGGVGDSYTALASAELYIPEGAAGAASIHAKAAAIHR